MFEIELIKQVEINVDYILMLVEQFRDAKSDGDDKEIRAAIERAVDSSPSLATRRTSSKSSSSRCRPPRRSTPRGLAFIAAKRADELDRIITEEGLDPAATHAFVEVAFRDGAVQPTGTAITKILPPVSRFAKAGGHSVKKRTVLQKLGDFFDRFFGLS